jgi:hypothetical protein
MQQHFSEMLFLLILKKWSKYIYKEKVQHYLLGGNGSEKSIAVSPSVSL